MHRFAAVLLVVLLLAGAAPADEKDDRIAALEASLEKAREDNRTLREQVDRALADLKELGSGFTLREQRHAAERARLDRLVADLRSEVTALGKRVEEIELDRTEAVKRLESRARNMESRYELLERRREADLRALEQTRSALDGQLRRFGTARRSLDERSDREAAIAAMLAAALARGEPLDLLSCADGLATLGHGRNAAAPVLAWAAAPEREQAEIERAGRVLVRIVEEAAAKDDASIVPDLLAGPTGAARTTALEAAFGGPLLPGDTPEALWKLVRTDGLAAVRRGAALVRAMGEKRVGGSYAAMPARDFLRRFSDGLGIDAVCLRDAANRAVTWSGKDVPAGRVLAEALASAGLAQRLVDGILVVGAPERLRALPGPDGLLPRPRGETWSKRVTFEFSDAAPGDVLDAVTRVSGTRLTLLGGTDARVTLAVTDLPALTAVRLVEVVTGLRARERWGTVLVGTPEVLAGLGPDGGESVADDDASMETARRLRSVSLSLRFDGTPLSHAVGVLGAAAKVEVKLADGVTPAAPVSVAAAATVEDLLRLILRPRGLSFRIEGGVLEVVVAE